jgi:hypothetical protein
MIPSRTIPRIGQHLTTIPDTGIERNGMSMRVEIKRGIALLRYPHAQEPGWHGHEHPAGILVREDAALFEMPLEIGCVVCGGEDEDWLQGLDGHEGALDSWRHDWGFVE